MSAGRPVGPASAGSPPVDEAAVAEYATQQAAVPQARALRVLTGGTLSLVEDLGRPGWFSSGVGVSGAVDPASLTLANRLVGNAEGAACIETLLGGLAVQAVGRLLVAVVGAPAPLTVDGVPAPHHAVLVLHDGQRLELGAPPSGMRAYVAVRGGLDVAPVLGSRSRDTLAGLGPPPLAGGDVLAVGTPHGPWPSAARVPVAVPVGGSSDGSADAVEVRVLLGPRDDWFTDPADLCRGTWTVSGETDRVGVRLDRPDGDPPLVRRTTRELATEGMPLGAVQVPPNGRPVVFLADHPITGGYPVIATVVSADLRRIAQARPGRSLRFRATRPDAGELR